MKGVYFKSATMTMAMMEIKYSTTQHKGLGEGACRSPMFVKRHKQARTTPAIRAEIQQPQGTLAEQAAR